ncbi:MAG: AhpC/TSA family protein [Bacteroidaceae bacterium]|nr:AhpC/TSA family protein [Bacteroidaceae bacterium]
MRQIIFILILLACCVSCTQQAFTIRGKIPGLQAGVVIGLLDAEDLTVGEIAADTVKEDGAFFITGKVSHPTLCTLTTNNLSLISDEVEAGNYEHVHWTYTPVFVENADMEIQVENYGLMTDAPITEDFCITGGEAQEDFNEYNLMLQNQTTANHTTVEQEFIRKHPTSVVSVMLANRMLQNAYNLTKEEIESLEQDITGCPLDTARYSEFKHRIDLAKQTAVYSTVIDLDMMKPSGDPCSLSQIVDSYQGKYLLIDFWASWCGICRNNTPHIKELYAQYPQEQFEVISVSADEKTDAWKIAMEKDDMPWAQYCLTSEGAKDFYEKYQTIGVPYYLIVSPEGKVLGNPGSVEKIDEMLQTLIQL